MKDADLSLSTQQAREEEKVRIKRLQEKQSTQLNSSLSSGCYSPVNNAAALSKFTIFHIVTCIS